MAFAFARGLEGLRDERRQFGCGGKIGLAGGAAARQQRRRFDELKLAVGGDFLDRRAAIYSVLNRIVVIDDRFVRLVLGEFGANFFARFGKAARWAGGEDRKSTRLNSSH